MVRNAKNTIAYFRDFLGKKYVFSAQGCEEILIRGRYSEIDPTNSHNSSHPIDVDGAVSFSIVEKTGQKATSVSVDEITTRHLRRLRQSAVDFLGKPVTGAVISVPTDFTEGQRAALVAAAKGADLQALQVVQEPVAEALSYAARENLQPHDKTLLVVDIGGTRSDATVIAVRGGMYTILATAHDYELGGVHLDQALVDHFAKEYVKKHKSDPRENERGLAKLKLESESVKRTLSIATTASIAVDSLCDGVDFHSSINRLRYEMLGRKVFDQIIKLTEHVVEKAELDLLDIDEVLTFFPLAPHHANMRRLSSPEVPPTPPRLRSDSHSSSLRLLQSTLLPLNPLLLTLQNSLPVVLQSKPPSCLNSMSKTSSNLHTPWSLLLLTSAKTLEL